MVWKKDEHVYTWNDLGHIIAPEVLGAPRTAGDSTGSWRGVHARVIGYVARNVVGKPWANHLTLIAAVFAAQRRDVSTVEGIVRMLHARFSSLFPLFELDDVRQWNIDHHLAPYVRGEVLPYDPPATRVAFFKRYMSATNLVAAWLDFLPEREQEVYQPFLLPTVNPFLAELLYKIEEGVRQQQQDHRKAETEAVVPQFTALRAEAHFRYNRMTRLWQAASQVMPDHSNLPFEFSYEEGNPPVERIQCRLWDRRSFVLHPEHASQYHEDTVGFARRKQRTFSAEHNEVFLELIKVERLEEDVTPEGFWFTDPLKRGLLGNKARLGTAQEIAEKQAWLRQWGYSEDKIASPFEAKQPGLLTWPDEHAEGRSTGRSTGNFIAQAQTHTNGTLIPVACLPWNCSQPPACVSMS